MNISPFNLDFNEQGLLKINNYNLPEKLEKGKILILGAEV